MTGKARRRAITRAAVVITAAGGAATAVAAIAKPPRPSDHRPIARARAPLIAPLARPGDPRGAGYALLRLNEGRRRVCFTMHVFDVVPPATAAHLHRSNSGAVVVQLVPPDRAGRVRGCVRAAPALIARIRARPRDYSVDVHTIAGPIRGQVRTMGNGKLPLGKLGDGAGGSIRVR